MPNLSSFEDTQRTNLKKMIESLAQQILASLQDTENADPKSQLSLLRVYAQYMNLYMKFESKYFPPNPEEQNKKENHPTVSPQEITKKPAKKSGFQPKLSTNGSIDFIRQSNHQHLQNQSQHSSSHSALILNPSSG
jgi:hypothetical protein